MKGQKYQDANGKWHREGDLPVPELIEMANRTMRESGGMATVYFKFTCEKCGERCTFQEKDTYFELGECAACGHATPYVKGGLTVHFNIGGQA